MQYLATILSKMIITPRLSFITTAPQVWNMPLYSSACDVGIEGFAALYAYAQWIAYILERSQNDEILFKWTSHKEYAPSGSQF